VDFKLAFERLTGRHVLGPGVFWSTLSFGFLAHALGSSDLSSGNLTARISGVAISHLAMMAVLAVVRLATRRFIPNLRSFLVVAVGYVLAGAVRGLVLQMALFEFEAADTAFSLYRLIGGVAVMTTGLAWATFAFGLKAEWSSKKASLGETKQQLEALLADSESRLELEASDTLSKIESMLQTALIPELASSPQSVLVKLKSLINDTLRPLSVSLAESQPKIELVRLDARASKLRWRTLLTQLRLGSASRPITTALILSVLAVNGFVKYLPQLSALLLLAITFVVMAALLAISKYVLARFVDRLPPWPRFATAFTTLFLVGFVGGLVVLSLGDNRLVALALSINGGIASALLGALFGVNGSATKEIQSIELQLTNYERELRWTIAALNGQHWMQKKQFARKIHGPIQSEVAAAAIRIERSLSRGEVTESGEVALQNLRDRLAKILADTKGISEVRPVLSEIAETWHGLCEIEFTLSEQDEQRLREDSVCVETVLEIAREACSNAIRHGSAEHINLQIVFESPDLVRISVANDGSKVDLGAHRGIGSAYLDDCTFSHGLTATKDGATLDATVPFRQK
jgi:signal transduction histidine kinase